jgi:nucleoside-diphosphate-sugar epimerase
VYAANKQAAEDLGRAYQATFGLDVVAVRFAAVFGPWRAGGGGAATIAVDRWVRAAVSGEPVEIDLGGADWIYSKDAAKGTHLACWADGLQDRLFNLGMGHFYGADDVAAAIDAAVPGSNAKVAIPAPIEGIPKMAMAPGAAAGKIMSIDRARNQLGYEPEFPMPAAIADYVEWARQIS